jgi:PIN domain nuclease of toxin-antitoxin system
LILLDTHVLVWAAEDRVELGEHARKVIGDAERSNALHVASISIWELSMLVAKGRLDLGRPVRDWIDMTLSRSGVRLVGLEPAIAIDAGSLPGDIHGDPGDRIIIATARWLGCPLLTADGRIQRYAEQGHVGVIDATC